MQNLAELEAKLEDAETNLRARDENELPNSGDLRPLLEVVRGILEHLKSNQGR